MARTLTCDICKKPTNRIVAKVWLSPRNGTETQRRWLSHAEYTAHADVGECCAASWLPSIRWQKRKTKPKKDKPTKKTKASGS